MPYFALCMEQGTGKTKVLIDTAGALFEAGRITTLIVVTDNSLHRAWVTEQVPIHLPPRIARQSMVWEGGKAQTLTYKRAWKAFLQRAPEVLGVAAFNIESVITGSAHKLLQTLLAAGPCLMVLDESTSVKSVSAKRTKVMWALMPKAAYRRIATGIPAPESPLNLYAQGRVLHPSFWREGSYFTFKHAYAAWEPRRNPATGKLFEVQVRDEETGLPIYRNLPALMAQWAPHSYRVMKDECLDLPPKVFQTIPFAVSAEQRTLLRQLADHHTMTLGTDADLRAYISLAITRMLRAQQITSGFVVAPDVQLDADGEPQHVWYKPRVLADNPRLRALLDAIERLPRQTRVIIWARFNHDVDVVAAALRETYGPAAVVTYDGRTPEEERTVARERFQAAQSPVRFFVGKSRTGGKGLTLTAASVMVFYSHEPGLERRLQAEDRAHRIGQSQTLTIMSLEAEQTWDRSLIAMRDGKYASMEQLLRSVPRDQWAELARGERQW